MTTTDPVTQLGDPRLLETEFIDWLIESDYLTEEDKRGKYRDILDVANRLALQPKQQVAETLSQEADELLFGGSAGPGKTEWLIRHGAREMLKYPGNRGVVFRRVFPSLNRTIAPRARALLAPWADYNKVEHVFNFHNGSVLELGALQYEDSVLAYQGTEFGLIMFEELTEFLPAQFEYLKGRLRAPVDGVRPHIVSTTNPGGVSHLWVKRRYVKPKPNDYAGDAPPRPMEVWRPPATGSDPEPLSRCFVPGLLEDNPKLLKRDPSYRNKLRSIANRGLRLALEKGDWDAIEQVEGAQWSQPQIDFHRVRVAPDRSELSRVAVGVDPSGGKGKTNDEQGIVAVGKGYDGDGYVLKDRSCKKSTHGWARQAVQLAIDVDADCIVVEDNFGGEMAESPLKDAARELGYEGRVIRRNAAGKNKQTRAEPVAVKYGDPERPESWGEEGIMHHVGDFESLENEMVTWRREDGISPNRLDAFVWAATEVIVGTEVDYDVEVDETPSITSDLMTMEF